MAGASEPPSGTVTLLFTDIEGSTRLLQGLGEGYREVMAAHRRLLREAWAAHGGAEVDTQGDSFFVTFARALDAVSAAVQVQRALAAHPWPDGTALRVRIGIHTGEPELAAGDYIGIDVHRAARISAAGHGGQVLLSAATVALLPPELPGGTELLDLGEYALKDLAQPEHLFQLNIPGLESAFPELKSAPAGRTNLPEAATPLVGREVAFAETRALLERDDVRLLTLTGPGGTGKTRLAVGLAAEAIEGFADGAYLVPLEPVADPDLVLTAIARTLPLGGRPAEPVAEWLADHLQGRDMLIVLDNFEHVLDAARALAELLARTPGPTVLVTSREPLHVAAEHTYPVPPLGLPDPGTSDPAALAASASVQLFLDRARAVRPDFRLTPETGASVAEICTRLDGLPLAIELAAPWLRVLEPEALASKLGNRLDLLGDSVRDLPERQRTLRGAIDWSYRLLDEVQQQLFVQLGVFAGGWSLEAPEVVCDLGGSDLLFALGALIDKNLVRREPGAGSEARFSMLESIRTFALERMDERGEGADVAERHAAFYLRLAEQAEPELYGPTQAIWMTRLSADLENLRAAMTWAAEAPDRAETGLGLVGALTFFWFFLGLNREGLDRAERMLAVGGDASPRARARALLCAGLLGSLAGDPAVAQERLEQSLALARDHGDRSSVARCLDWLGLLTFFRDDVSGARHLLEESSVAAREAGDLWCLADALGTLGSILPLQGAFDAVDAASGEALDIARRAGDDQGVRMALFGRALTTVRRGELAVARSAAHEGLRISRAIGDVWFISYFQWVLALAHVEGGDLPGARAFAEESLEVARRIEAPLLIVCALEARAATSRAEGDSASAAVDLEEARRMGAGGGVPTSYASSVVRGLGLLAHERGDAETATPLLTEAADLARAVADEWGANAAMLGLAQIAVESDPAGAGALVSDALRRGAELGAKLQVAEGLEIAAALAAERGDPARTLACLVASEEILSSVGATRAGSRRTRFDALTSAARDALGEEAGSVLVDAGAAGWQAAVGDVLGTGPLRGPWGPA